MEACLKEPLPPPTELEESLRNGVTLAKLGHFFAPDACPLGKIYDLNQARFQVRGSGGWSPLGLGQGLHTWGSGRGSPPVLLALPLGTLASAIPHPLWGPRAALGALGGQEWGGGGLERPPPPASPEAGGPGEEP